MHAFPLQTGAQIPSVGLGTYRLRDGAAEEAVDLALGIGYRLIDTACVYRNEEAIGRVVAKWIESGRINRSDLFITSKLGALLAATRTRLTQRSAQRSRTRRSVSGVFGDA
jgi:diketogulonate reductase-like aldo/keto reductase